MEEFRGGVAELSVDLDTVLTGRMKDLVFAMEASRLAANVPERLAQQSALWPLLHTSFDVVELARRHALPVRDAGRLYWQVFERLDVSWLWDAIGALPRADRWQTQARAALRDDLMSGLADLTDDVAGLGTLDDWMALNGRVVERTERMLTEIRRAGTFDVTTLSVAMRQLRNLSLTTQRLP